MDAKELRIGNWVTGAYPFQIEKIRKNGNFNIYDPIPITPEILEKCGFENKIKHSSWKWQKRNRKLVFNIAMFEEYCRFLDTEGRIGFTPFKYLHQLQNLYFALTGEELKVNLTELQPT